VNVSLGPLEPAHPRDRVDPPHPAFTTDERLAVLALFGPILTALDYVLPSSIRLHTALQFLPQVVAYLCLIVWARANTLPLARLGLRGRRIPHGLRWGIPIGTFLGTLNVSVILWVVPWTGEDIAFLRDTPHARMPMALMFPWVIMAIAVLVELNFRGFLLGRLLALWHRYGVGRYDRLGQALAVLASAFVFAFDPFMVATFKHLHWIALWDGIVWGTLWLRLRNLYAVIVAHAVEVMILYVVLKRALFA
jgi:membrane protease YdiL (CAAX protease family)